LEPLLLALLRLERSQSAGFPRSTAEFDRLHIEELTVEKLIIKEQLTPAIQT
jgi:hypothetical protein